MTPGRTPIPRTAMVHPVAAAGSAVSAISAVLLVAVWLAQGVGWLANPYIGLVSFVALPALLVAGLLLIPAGWWLARRRAARGRPALHWPTLDCGDPRIRGWAVLVIAVSAVSVLLVGVAGVKAVHFMDSPTFCGQVCHTPMEPHFVQWRRGPSHTKVACAACHVAPGAAGFVAAKTRGTAQLWHVLADDYPRPVPSPVAQRPAAEQMCGTCHDAARWFGDRPRVYTDVSSDEANTMTRSAMTLKVGGTRADGTASGFHWHTSPGVEVEYVATDRALATIPWVRVRMPDGQVREYAVEGFDAGLGGGERRRMDCVDCHNKVAHRFAASAERAVDEAFAEGQLDPALPYLRREAVTLLKSDHAAGQVEATIGDALRTFYAGAGASSERVDDAVVTSAVRVLTDLYRANVFPAMNVTFGTYVSFAGHTDADGCFRCHDGMHESRDGRVIPQECESCHRDEDVTAGTP